MHALRVNRVTNKEAWAVIDSDGINIRSVSPTRTAAIVNWLYTETMVAPKMSWTDDEIELTWQEHKGNAVAARVAVSRIMNENM